MRKGFMENVIISGSSGLVATQLIHRLLADGNYFIYALSTNVERITERYSSQKNIKCLSIEELDKVVEEISFKVFFNCAFARTGNGNDYASSLDYLRRLLQVVNNLKLETFVNISSQSIYGQSEKPPWTERTSANPNHLYAIAKYATEVIVSSSLEKSAINFTNIRLASVCENARFLNVFVQNAIEGKPVRVIGGNQKISFIDVRDVAEALMLLLRSVDQKFDETYNLGIGESRSILDLAKDLQRIYRNTYSKDVIIEFEESDVCFEVGMSSELFYKRFEWKPKYSYDDMIISLIEYSLHFAGGGVPFVF